MPKTKVFLSLVVMVMVLALVGGATMAWFTDSTDPIENVFTAGTLEIEAGDKTQIPNWNPGDNDEIEFCVKNVGTKNSLVRIGLDGEWSPGPFRILVLYTSDSIQLIGVEWSTFCQGCTGKTGALATAFANYTYNSIGQQPNVLLTQDSYFTVAFSNIDAIDGRDQDDVERWLGSGSNISPFTGWCLDKDETISMAQINAGQQVTIYDPLCNTKWYEEATSSSALRNRWKEIDFDKISYVINHDFMARGYNSTEIQQSIWNYTNGSFHGNRYIVGNAQDIVDYIEDISGGGKIKDALNAISDTVMWDLHPDSDDSWFPITTMVTAEDGTSKTKTHYYYDGVIGDDEEVCLKLIVRLSGPNTGNMFQGMDYTVSGYFEAVQASNNASGSVFGVDSIYNPTDPESSENWESWDD